MTVTLKRQITEEEKSQILKQHGRRCFANGHTIPEGEPIHFDHIRAFALGGPSELGNIAPMCGQHNTEKGTLSLEDFRVKLQLREFFSSGDRLTLHDLLQFLQRRGEINRFGDPCAIDQDGDSVTVSFASKSMAHSLYTCPITGWRYFYSILDAQMIDSDDDQDDSIGLQPRYLLSDKVFDLYRHFQRHPVLQPSVGRVVNNRIRLFDGQHKAAALLFNGRRSFECKVYLSPDLRLLNQTNIAAHDKFAQTRFFSSIMVMKLGTQFGADFEVYKQLDDGEAKTEAGFLSYLQKKDEGAQTKAQISERFRSYLYHSVLEHPDATNKVTRFVSAGNRGTDEKPITIDMLTKSLFSAFLLREPTTDDMVTDKYKRDHELENIVALLNSIHDLALCEWDAKASGAGVSRQRQLSRIFRSKAMMAWSELLRDAICGKLDIEDGEDRARPLYREMTDGQRHKMREIVRRLLAWNRWNSPENDEIDRVLSDNKSAVKDWFRTHGLTTGYLMGAPQ